MLVIAQQTIPRGGTITVNPIGDGETMGFRVVTSGFERAHTASRRRSSSPGTELERRCPLRYSLIIRGYWPSPAD